jgi:bifunctional non-homologous end joining protein LigD
VEIEDPLVEPLWSGTRVLVHLVAREDGSVGVRILDVFGVDLAGEVPDITKALGEAFRAVDAVLDGILTDQATRGGVGTAIVTESRASVVGMMVGREASVEVVPRGAGVQPAEALVAFDLLRIDGESLLDVPLLERKRLLESVLEEGDLVRVSVHARAPVDPWVASWKAAGLKGAMLKAANSRYVPGSATPEWRAVTKVAGRR